MKRLNIDLSDDEIKLLVKRAEDNLMSLQEQVEDIVRRSCVSYSKNKTPRPIKCDDKLVAVFSRQKSGRKPRKTKKVKKTKKSGKI